MKVDNYWLRKIHPKIEEFWTNLGYEIVVLKPNAYINNVLYVIIWVAQKEYKKITVAVSETIGSPNGACEDNCKIKYIINNTSYSEEDALKVISMAAFI